MQNRTRTENHARADRGPRRPVDVMALEGDTAPSGPTLKEHLAAWAGTDEERSALAALICTIAEASLPLARRLAMGHLPGDPTSLVGTNETGDRQKRLDVAAHDHFVAALRDAPVAKLLSEEAEGVVELDPGAPFDVAMDPVDGSGSIGIGATLGTLFCVFPRGADFRRSGRDIVAAGYLSFGHTIDLGMSVGEGVAIATYDPESGVFRVDAARAQMPGETATIAFNASNQRHWAEGMQRYVGDLVAGADGPRGRDFNMRWIAAAVGDLHRILRRGGLFLYPADSRPGRGDGHLRLAYEAFPIAYLIEQAGGAATDGKTPILDRVPDHPHARVPLIFGSAGEVAAVQCYLSKTDP